MATTESFPSLHVDEAGYLKGKTRYGKIMLRSGVGVRRDWLVLSIYAFQKNSFGNIKGLLHDYMVWRHIIPRQGEDQLSITERLDTAAKVFVLLTGKPYTVITRRCKGIAALTGDYDASSSKQRTVPR